MPTSFTFREVVETETVVQYPQVRKLSDAEGGGYRLSDLTLEQVELLLHHTEANLKSDAWLSNSERKASEDITRAIRVQLYDAPISLDDKELALVAKLIRDERLIQAIRAVRYITGAGLKASKEYAERLRDNLNTTEA